MKSGNAFDRNILCLNVVWSWVLSQLVVNGVLIYVVYDRTAMAAMEAGWLSSVQAALGTFLDSPTKCSESVAQTKYLKLGHI